MTKRTLTVTTRADLQLLEIVDRTQDRFGESQATRYAEAFSSVYRRLVDFPDIGKERNDVSPGLRYVVVQAHHVYYRVFSDSVEIVRILHQSQDVNSQDWEE